jgi:hypothetical protein
MEENYPKKLIEFEKRFSSEAGSTDYLMMYGAVNLNLDPIDGDLNHNI